MQFWVAILSIYFVTDWMDHKMQQFQKENNFIVIVKAHQSITRSKVCYGKHNSFILSAS